MTATSISFSYFFLGIALITLSFHLFFKMIYTEISSNGTSIQTIFGEIRHREEWIKKNKLMSYISLFWASISMILFICLKFFLAPSLMSIFYLLFYTTLIIISIIYGTVNKKTKA